LTMPRLEAGAGSPEIFYCARASCSALCYSQAELERHALSVHTGAERLEEIETEFSFDSDEEMLEESMGDTDLALISLTENAKKEENGVKKEEPSESKVRKTNKKIRTPTPRRKAENGVKMLDNHEHVKNEDASENKMMLEQSNRDIALAPITLTENVKKEENGIKKEEPSETKVRKTKKKISKNEHPVNQVFVCPVCNESFKAKGRLDTHQFKAHNVGGIVCDTCAKTCSNALTLKNHQRVYHSGAEKTPCHLCGKLFPNKHGVSAHLNSGIHTDATIKCSRCPKLFPSKYYLKSHERVHDVARFLCSDCPTSFRWKKRLEKHQHLSHGKPLPFKTYACDECGKVFYFSSEFLNHKKFHQGHPASTCEICHKTFHKPETMRTHVKYVHNKVKNYSCDRCDYKAGQKEKFEKHVKKVHEKEMETCNICKEQVKHSYHHVKSHHKDIENAWEVHKELKSERVV